MMGITLVSLAVTVYNGRREPLTPIETLCDIKRITYGFDEGPGGEVMPEMRPRVGTGNQFGQLPSSGGDI